MRFLSFVLDHEERFGALIENRVVDLGERMSEYGSLKEVISAGALVRARDIAAESSADYALKDVSFAIPITEPEKIICVEGNFAGAGNADPDVPLRLCFRTRESLVGHQQPLLRPVTSPQLDYGGGIALIIGRAARRVAAAEALDHVAGMTLANDGLIRDRWRRDPTQGRCFAGSGALGPYLVTPDELDDPELVGFETRVNGEVRQTGSTADLSRSFSTLISDLSGFMTLSPGDIILTGSPPGSGADQDPPLYLSAGDTLEVEAEGFGLLTSVVSDESEPNGENDP